MQLVTDLIPFDRIKKEFKNLGAHNYLFYAMNISKEEVLDKFLDFYEYETMEQFSPDNGCISSLFIQEYGNLIAINEITLEVKTIWDTDVPSPFGRVFNSMNELILSRNISNCINLISMDNSTIYLQGL